MHSLLLCLYFSSILMLSFVSHPVGYCLLLLVSALSMSGCCYMVLGFSWYLILFCLVYIGGVYVLFIYVSVHSPNSLPSLGLSFLPLLFSFFALLFFFSGLSVGEYVFIESSYHLCSAFEGLSYCFFCIVLLLGFVLVSVVCSEKDAFFR